MHRLQLNFQGRHSCTELEVCDVFTCCKNLLKKKKIIKTSQKGKERKKSKSDSLCEQKKNKKEMEFEQKLAKEKEGMLEKEKQLKINRLVQEVCCVLLSSAKLLGKKMS